MKIIRSTENTTESNVHCGVQHTYQKMAGHARQCRLSTSIMVEIHNTLCMFVKDTHVMVVLQLCFKCTNTPVYHTYERFTIMQGRFAFIRTTAHVSRMVWFTKYCLILIWKKKWSWRTWGSMQINILYITINWIQSAFAKSWDSMRNSMYTVSTDIVL